MYSSINDNEIMGMFFLDIAKAFNCINHNMLFSKMKDVEMSDRVIQWFRSYLNRSQLIGCGDTTSTSSILDIPAGIAQGTVLGILSFTCYINDMNY